MNMVRLIRGRYFKQMHFYHFVLFALGIMFIYWPVHEFEFLIGWDDQWYVTNRYTENGFTWDNLYAIFSSFHYGQYAPLNQIYYTTLYGMFGYNPVFYHLASVIIHLGNVILIYYFINWILLELSYPKSRSVQISFWTAFLFAILPVNIESVAWVSASKVLLYALCYLSALLFYCRYLTSSRPIYFYGTLLFFLFSFGAKEQAVLLPVSLLLLDYLYNRNLASKKVWLEKLPFIILTILFGLVTIQSQGLDAGARSFYPILQRVPLAFYTLSEYFTKCIIPVNLLYLYPFPFLENENVVWWLWIYVIVVPINIYCFHEEIKAKWVLFGLSFFFIHLALVSNIFPLSRYSVVADRYVYLASIGLCFLLAHLFVVHARTARFKLILTIFIIYCTSLILYSRSHIMVWKNTDTLKEKLASIIESRHDFYQLRHLK